MHPLPAQEANIDEQSVEVNGVVQQPLVPFDGESIYVDRVHRLDELLVVVVSLTYPALPCVYVHAHTPQP